MAAPRELGTPCTPFPALSEEDRSASLPGRSSQATNYPNAKLQPQARSFGTSVSAWRRGNFLFEDERKKEKKKEEGTYANSDDRRGINEQAGL
ncbi:hypothetical protein K0M31_002646, partial [Melipona bicolor]